MRTDSEIVALSAMMTTMMMGMKKGVQMIREKNPRGKMMLEGAPLTPDVVSFSGRTAMRSRPGMRCSRPLR